jgi:hypothetical protein
VWNVGRAYLVPGAGKGCERWWAAGAEIRVAVGKPCIYSCIYELSHISSAVPWEVALNKENYVRFEVFTAVTMKNDVFCDIKTLFVLHRRHVTSPLQSRAS